MASLQQGWPLRRWFCFLKTIRLDCTAQARGTASLTRCCVLFSFLFLKRETVEACLKRNLLVRGSGAGVTPVLRCPKQRCPSCTSTQAICFANRPPATTLTHLGVVPRAGKQESAFFKVLRYPPSPELQVHPSFGPPTVLEHFISMDKKA